MKASFYIKAVCVAASVLLLLGVLCIAPSAVFRRDYKVTVDVPSGITSTGSAALLKNVDNGPGDTLRIAGWIKADFTMSYYEYTIDGGKTWVRAEGAVIARNDVQQHCPNTYKTAGFDLSIDVSALQRGTYDVFLRGYTDEGDVVDTVVMLDVAIGRADTHTMAYTEINLRAFEVQSGKMLLHAGQPVVLGAYNLRNYQSAELILDQAATVTLRSSADAAFPFEAQFADPVQNDDGTYTMTIALDEVQYAGELVLGSDTELKIDRLRLYTTVPDYYTGELTVHMTTTPYEFFSGANNVDAAISADETVGTFTRLYPVNETNDPFIYFNLGKYLKQTQGMQISADHYRYMVITMQAPETNSPGHFRLFLCAGEIHGPHGDSHVSFTPTNDGKWHRYVIPLCEEEHWTGQIYGMRFDFIDANAKPSDYANIASISLFADEQSAKQAAAQPYTPYYEGGQMPEDIYKEEGRAPSGRADAITWFDASLDSCFSGANKASWSFDEYGHLLLMGTETTNDPYLSFDLRQYAALTGQNVLHTGDYAVVVLRVLADREIAGKNFTLYYYTAGYDYAQGTRAVGATFKGEEWEYLVYDMSEVNYWTDEIWGFRLDFASQISAGQQVCLSDVLFFADIEAWETYALANGIPVYGFAVTDPSQTQAPETEVPTIEIPTQGPGLEYIPPEQHPENTASCKSIVTLPLCLLLPLAAVALIQIKTKKGDPS